MAKQPAKKFRYDNISVAVWENEGTNGSFHSITLERSYRDGEELKNTSSLRARDLLTAARALQRAHAWIYERDE